jgi:hypothetical protein
MREITNACKTWVTKIKDGMSLQRRVEGGIIFLKIMKILNPGRGKRFFSKKKSGPALGPNQLPVQHVQGSILV